MNSLNENPVANDDVQVDRDIPKLNSSKKKNNLSRMGIAAGLMVGVIAVAGGCVLFLGRLEESKKAQAAEQAKQKPPAAVQVVNRDFEATKKRIKAEELAGMPPPAAAFVVTPGAQAQGGTPGGAMAVPAGAIPVQGQAQPGAIAGGARGGATTTAAARVPTLADRRMSGDILVTSNGGGNGAGSGAAQPVPRAGGSSESGMPPAGGFMGASAPTSRGGLDDKLKPSNLVAGVAVQRPDLNMLLRRGTSIECTQKTRIVTTNPGGVGCTIAKDVWSSNGAVKLIERGSEAFGELRDNLVAGQAFVPVLWSRIETPSGVVVDINSFGTDSLGASGQPVYVDNHLMQRFGGAVLLSLISDFGQALSNKASDGGGSIQLTTSSRAGQDLASRTLESTINIPPTGYGRQGDVINIFVMRDIDFRGVYELARH
jgi:type IV secretion system protein VirB10